MPSPRADDQARRRLVAGYFVAALLVAATAAALVVVVTRDGGGGDGGGPVHIHGLGVNPADDSLFIATHTGLFSSPKASTEAERVGSSLQDTMGFTVVGPDRFLGSGHPGPGDDGPPNLGLIESTDGGRSWQEVSLAGEADFHVLRHAHDRVYAVNALTGLLMLSDDGGETWTEREAPAAVIDLAVDPDDSEHFVASTEDGLAVSDDDGESWRSVSGEIGLLAWPVPRRLYLVSASGEVLVSENRSERWRHIGNIGEQPVALTALGAREVYAALVDGTVLRSPDGGASWDIRVEP